MDTPARNDGLYFLKRNSLFGPLGEEILLELSGLLKTLQIHKGGTLLRENEPGEALYLIKSGRVRLVSHSENGEDVTVAFLGHGDSVGELALLTGEPHAFSAIADTTADFLVLAKADFDAVLEKHPLVGVHLSRALSKRLAVSFHPPQNRPKSPQLVTVVPGLPYEATLLAVINLSISLVEQTRRRVVLVDISPRSGDIARALGLPNPLSNDRSLREDELSDIQGIQALLSVHPSGLEVLSLAPKLLKDLLPSVPTLLAILKDHYDFVLLLPPTEKDVLSQTVLQESDRVLLLSWDQAPDLGVAATAILQENLGTLTTPVQRVVLQHPSSQSPTPADFRIPWTESFHQPFRETGSPYLVAAQAEAATAALDRLARALGKLRVGLAMGSGAAYGYTLVGLLKVFEREKIPIDMVAGTSMGALLGSFFCAGLSPDRIAEVSRSITKRWLFENIFGDLTFPHSGFLAGQTLNAFLRSVLGMVEFDQLPIPFAAIATDIRSGHEVVLREGRVADAVRASTSLPIIFRPFLHKGRFLVDGGLVNPVPTATVANMGADILISVNLTAKPSVRRGLGRYRSAFPLAPRFPSLNEVFVKMIYTMQYEIAQSRTEIAHVVISPDVREYLWTDFHRSDDIALIGETYAEEAVPKIKALLPFFANHCKVPLSGQ